MRLSIICFTRKGYEKAKILKTVGLVGTSIEIFCKCEALRGKSEDYTEESLDEWAFKCFNAHDAMFFIGAAGIAVRTIAPYLKSKLIDSPVVVMDDAARYVIPILSGHVGGANELATRIAAVFKAECAITTATDVNNIFAIDNFAVENRLEIINKEGIASVSAKLLDGGTITIGLEDGIEIDESSYDAFLKSGKGDVRIVGENFSGRTDVWIGEMNKPRETSLYLYPKTIAVGIGCKKGKTAREIEDFIIDRLKREGINGLDVFCIASIDIKKEEEGLVHFAAKHGFDFITFSAEELDNIEGDFSESEFVKNTVGTGSVAERAAVAACGGGELICRKQAENGITFAVARGKVKLIF